MFSSTVSTKECSRNSPSKDICLTNASTSATEVDANFSGQEEQLGISNQTSSGDAKVLPFDKVDVLNEDVLTTKRSNSKCISWRESNREYEIFGKWKLPEKYYVLGLFTLINIGLFSDQNLLAPNLTVIAAEYGMTDIQRDEYLGGYIALGFFTVGGIVAVIVGCLADSVNRKWTFTFTVLLGEISCFLTYWVPTNEVNDFWSGLFLTRVLTGIAIGGAIPIQYSLFGDYFPPDQRGRALAFITVCPGLGTGGGQFLAGFMSPNWRAPFLVVSIPVFFLVAVYAFTTTEPKRGSVELADCSLDNDRSNKKINMNKLKGLFSRRSAVLTIVLGLPATLAWGVITVFLNDFLNEEKGFTAPQSAGVLTMFGISLFTGTVVSGWLMDKYYERHLKLMIFIAGTTTMTAPLLFLIIFNESTLSVGLAILTLMVVGLFGAFAGVPLKVLLMNVVIPETRGTAFSLDALVNEIGRGAGPFLVAQIIKTSESRSKGLSYSVLGWIPTGLMIILLTRYIDADLKRNKAEIESLYRKNDSLNGIELSNERNEESASSKTKLDVKKETTHLSAE